MVREKQIDILRKDNGAAKWNKLVSSHNPYICLEVSGAQLRGVDLSRANLKGVRLGGADLSGANLAGAILVNGDFSNTNLSGADLSHADLTGANLFGADLSGADLSHAKINRAVFFGANLERSTLCRAHAIDADFYGANLKGADGREANMSGSICSQACLGEAIFHGACFTGSDLSLADVSKADFRGASFMGADLSGIEAYDVNLMGSDLFLSDLSGGNFYHADISDADLFGVDLSGANLSETMLVNTDFSKADLAGCYLFGAQIMGAKFHKTNLKLARMGCSIFADVDLSTAKHLEDVVHYCPSTIGLDTIYRSRAAISTIFLKNSGVRSSLIKQMASMLKDDDSSSCKINYSTVDHRIAYKIYIDLQKHGVDCWLSSDGSVFKRKQKYVIERDFTLYSKNIFLLSCNSIVNSCIVRDMKTVLKEEKRRRKRGRKETMFLPVRLDRFNVPKELSWINKLCDKRLICDFSDWRKNYCYQKGIERLLHVLVAPISPDLGAASA